MFTAAASPTRRWPRVLACRAHRLRQLPLDPARRRSLAARHSGPQGGFPDLNSVGMKRPVAERLGFAEFYLCQFRGLALAGSVDFQRALTDLDLSAVAAKHILHE